jgi:hypothetical protein
MEVSGVHGQAVYHVRLRNSCVLPLWLLRVILAQLIRCGELRQDNAAELMALRRSGRLSFVERVDFHSSGAATWRRAASTRRVLSIDIPTRTCIRDPLQGSGALLSEKVVQTLQVDGFQRLHDCIVHVLSCDIQRKFVEILECNSSDFLGRECQAGG